jgi:hypothetical protein
MEERASLKKGVSLIPQLRRCGVLDAVQTDLDDCAQVFIDIARNSSMTGREIQVGMFSRKKQPSRNH